MRLLDQYRQLHEGDTFPGLSIMPFVYDLKHVIRAHGSRSLLDYGSGKGRQYKAERVHEIWGVPIPYCYDPAAPGRDVKPAGQFDGVICTDVLEHIPEDELPEVIDEISGYAKQWAFLSVCCRLAKKSLPDGTNAHVTVKPFGWWQELLVPRFRATLILVETK